METLDRNVPMTSVKERLRAKRALDRPMETVEAVLARPVAEVLTPPQVRRDLDGPHADRDRPAKVQNVRAFVDALRDEEIEWGSSIRALDVPAVTLTSDGLIGVNIHALKCLGIPADATGGYPIRAGLMAHGTILVIEPVADPDAWVPKMRQNREFQPGIDLLERAWASGRYPAIYDDVRNRILIRREDWGPHQSGRTPGVKGKAKSGPKGPRKSRTGVVLDGVA